MFNTLEKIKLGGIDQVIYIASNNDTNPVLLILHGGPGFVMMPLFHQYNKKLEEKFTIVQWDQRGAGKSYHKNIPRKSMTLKQFIQDAHELTTYLKQKFGQNKIYLLGHSTGSMIGIMLAHQYPKDYLAYIGIGQVISFVENEKGCYQFALDKACEHQHSKAIKQLKDIGAPDNKGEYDDEEAYEITSHWVEEFGGALYNQKNLDQLYEDIFKSDIYKHDEQNILKGYEFSQYLFDDKAMRNFNIKKMSAFKIPVYFISGQYDYDTPVNLVRDYAHHINAKLITFEHSAHFPFYEEPEKFNDVLISLLIAI